MLPTGSNRVNRGGSWNNNANNCRVANRNNNNPDNANNNIGFRACLPPAHQARWTCRAAARSAKVDAGPLTRTESPFLPYAGQKA